MHSVTQGTERGARNDLRVIADELERDGKLDAAAVVRSVIARSRR